jgi:plastocyanin
MFTNEIFKITKIRIIVGSVILILLVAVGLQKFSGFKPFSLIKYYISGDYQSRYYRPSEEHFPKTYSGPSAETNLNIFIRDSKFLPNASAMPPGSKVTWLNEDKITHNITGEGWTSGDLAPGQSFSKIFDTPGDYKYSCSIHPAMTGEIKIQ